MIPIIVPSYILGAHMAEATAKEKSDSVKNAILEKMMEHAKAQSATVAALEVVVPEPEPEPLVLQDGQKAASDILGFGKAAMRKIVDFAVDVLDINEVPIQIRALIPDINPTFRPNVGAATALLRAWMSNDTCLITGPTGCGKSELVKHLCALTNRPFIRINMTEDIDSSSVFGTMGAKDGSTYWIDGPAAEAVKYGGILNIDEYDVMPPGIAMGFQWLLENNGKLFLKEAPGTAADKTINPHENFRIVLNGNTVGQGDESGSFAGTQVQNTAMIDRIRTTIKMDYAESSEEIQILSGAIPKASKDFVNKAVKFASLVRSSYKQGSIGLTVSPRTLINWADKTLVWGDAKKALELAYLNKLRDSDKKVVTDLYIKVFGSA